MLSKTYRSIQIPGSYIVGFVTYDSLIHTSIYHAFHRFVHECFS